MSDTQRGENHDNSLAEMNIRLSVFCAVYRRGQGVIGGVKEEGSRGRELGGYSEGRGQLGEWVGFIYFNTNTVD